MLLPSLGGAGANMFSCCTSICASVQPSVSICDVPVMWYYHALIDFHQNFVTSASWDKGELIKFSGQRLRSQHDKYAVLQYECNTSLYVSLQHFVINENSVC